MPEVATVDGMAKWRTALQAGPSTVCLDGLLDREEADVVALLRLVVNQCVGFSVGGQNYGNATDAVLNLDAAVESFDLAVVYIRTVLRTTLLRRPDHLDFVVEDVVDRLKRIGRKGPTAAKLKIQAAALVRELDMLDQFPTPRCGVKSVLPDAPVEPGFLVPTGWILTTAGISRKSATSTSTVAFPMILTGRRTSLDGESLVLNVAWKAGGKWTARFVPREVLANLGLIVHLAAFGLPVHTLNASLLVEFLAEFEAVNHSVLAASVVLPATPRPALKTQKPEAR